MYTSKELHFGKVYIEPLHGSSGPCAYLYDNTNLKLNFIMCNTDRALIVLKVFSIFHTPTFAKGLHLYSESNRKAMKFLLA